MLLAIPKAPKNDTKNVIDPLFLDVVSHTVFENTETRYTPSMQITEEIVLALALLGYVDLREATCEAEETE